jgi:RND family efflux transporter MFP subunit
VAQRRSWSALAVAALICCAHADVVAPAADNDAAAIRVLLVASLETTLSSQMNGTLGMLRASLGQKVSKDALLVEMDCRELDARVNVAQAELSLAGQALDAKRGLQQLSAAGEVEVQMAATELQKAEGALALANAQRSYCRVRAPFSARIAKIHVKPYQTIAAGTALFDLVSDGTLKVRLNAPSTYLARLAPGTALEISIHETGKSYPAKVSAISSRIDAVAQTVELEAKLDGTHPELISGMSGVARLK